MRKNETFKGMLAFLMCYLLWGFQPLYWTLCTGMDTLFLMASRIVFAGLCCIVILWIRGSLRELKEVFFNRAVMKREAPASLFLFADWIIYLFAVRSEKVMECALGYYIMPLVIFAFGAILYREHVTWNHLAVLGFVIAGIAAGTSGFGGVPYVTVALALCFAVYSAIKKGVEIDSIVGTTAEILLMVPLALLYILFFCRTETGLYGLTPVRLLILIGSGVMTGLPMVFYAIGLRRIPLTFAGLFQYLAPTISIICSLFMGETLTRGKLISFALIWLGIILYTFITMQEEKKENELPSSR